MTAASGSSAPVANGSVPDPASSPTSVDVGAGRGPDLCPRCGNPTTWFESEPADEIWTHGGWREYLSVWTRYEPCGCTVKTSPRADPAVSRTLHVAEQTAAMNREAGR